MQLGNDSEEIRMFYDKPSDIPLTDFFTNGEIHNRKLRGVLTLIT